MDTQAHWNVTRDGSARVNDFTSICTCRVKVPSVNDQEHNTLFYLINIVIFWVTV
jgi:hypothetical protein